MPNKNTLKFIGFIELKHHMDYSIGVYVIDRFTYYTLEFLETVDQNSKKTIHELVSYEIDAFINADLNFCVSFYSI